MRNEVCRTGKRFRAARSNRSLKDERLSSDEELHMPLVTFPRPESIDVDVINVYNLLEKLPPTFTGDLDGFP